MGESRRKALIGQANGHQVLLQPRARVRMVQDLRIENVLDQNVMILMLGTKRPEIGFAMTAEQSRKLAEALLKHAHDLEQQGKRIWSPGGDV